MERFIWISRITVALLLGSSLGWGEPGGGYYHPNPGGGGYFTPGPEPDDYFNPFSGAFLGAAPVRRLRRHVSSKVEERYAASVSTRALYHFGAPHSRPRGPAVLPSSLLVPGLCCERSGRKQPEALVRRDRESLRWFLRVGLRVGSQVD